MSHLALGCSPLDENSRANAMRLLAQGTNTTKMNALYRTTIDEIAKEPTHPAMDIAQIKENFFGYIFGRSSNVFGIPTNIIKEDLEVLGWKLPVPPIPHKENDKVELDKINANVNEIVGGKAPTEKATFEALQKELLETRAKLALANDENAKIDPAAEIAKKDADVPKKEDEKKDEEDEKDAKWVDYKKNDWNAGSNDWYNKNSGKGNKKGKGKGKGKWKGDWNTGDWNNSGNDWNTGGKKGGDGNDWKKGGNDWNNTGDGDWSRAQPY